MANSEFDKLERYFKNMLGSENHDGVLPVTDLGVKHTADGVSTTVDTVVYDKEADTLRYYTGNPTGKDSGFGELALPQSEKHRLLSLVRDDIIVHAIFQEE